MSTVEREAALAPAPAWQTLTLRTPAAPRRQLAFVLRFPAYGAVRDRQGTWIAYDQPDGAQSLCLADPTSNGSISVLGDREVASRLLQADRDVAPLDHLVARLPSSHPLRSLHLRYRGLRPVLFPGAFEGLCWTILAQQVSVQAAASIRRRLVEHLGTAPVGAVPPGLLAFPGPSRLLALGPEDLRTFGVSRQKASAILHLSRTWPKRPFDLDLATQSAEDAVARLKSMPGIGRWSAEYALVRIFGHPDALPAADIGLRRAWGRLVGLSSAVSEQELRAAAAASLTGWRSLFAFYLWSDNLDRRSTQTPSGGP